MPKLIDKAGNTVSVCLFWTPDYFGSGCLGMNEKPLPTKQNFL